MSRLLRPVVAFATAFLVLTGVPFGGDARAQRVLLDVKSPVAGARAEFGVAIGDWDGDGIGDLAIGAPLDGTAASEAGAVRIHAGSNGSVLATFYGAAAGERFGWSVARMPDLDGDGQDDLAVGALGTVVSGSAIGSVYLYSGRTGTFQRRIDSTSTDYGFGERIGPMGDVDGDGIADLYVAHVGAGEVHVRSGADGHEITTITGSAGDFFGYAVCALDDLDGDGVRDLLIGAKHHFDAQNNPVGAAYVCSGATGAILRTHVGTWNVVYLGYDTAALGDLDGDGVDDYAMSAYMDLLNSTGAVFVFSGATGNQLSEFFPPVKNLDSFLTQVVGAGDVNGDGVGDIAVEGFWVDVNSRAWGSVYFFSGKTFLCLDRIELPLFVLSLSPFGDLDGDGLGDLIVGGYEIGVDGEVRVYSGNDLWLNATPDAARTNDVVELNTREGPAGNLTALVLVAIDGTPTFQMVGGVRSFDATGGDLQSARIPSGLAGHDFSFRAYANDASGKVISSAVQVLKCR